ncbi:methylated-DNA-protein-cysteine methyltransferase [Cutibacterium acnes JCM 18918]|nr:methylated-DNA-protein-cysteine methyltransferase [Cutibacterium acnes JCM 18918]
MPGPLPAMTAQSQHRFDTAIGELEVTATAHGSVGSSSSRQIHHRRHFRHHMLAAAVTSSLVPLHRSPSTCQDRGPHST